MKSAQQSLEGVLVLGASSPRGADAVRLAEASIGHVVAVLVDETSMVAVGVQDLRMVGQAGLVVLAAAAAVT